MKFEISPKETEAFLNWFDAKLYCFSLNIDGKTGWRLPTKDELNHIYEYKNDFGCTYYWDFVDSFYWSSSEYNANYAWCQNLSNGVQLSNYGKNYISYVRAVRDLT
jgi:hypothetical protein